MKGLICVLIVLICAQSWVVEGKNRNRVQKWQQRTWKMRFGNVPRKDWKFDVPIKGRSHRRNLYAGAHYGGLSQREIDMLTGNSGVPNGYSNFHYHFYDAPKTVSYGNVLRQSHRDSKKSKNIPSSSTNQIQNFRMKRFAFRDEDDDAEPEHFSNDLSNAPFVFDTDFRHERDEYPEDQGYINDLADLDFVRDDETIDFFPLQADPNQRYITVEENDPFPHAAPPASPLGRKNVTQRVQYKLIIHHGDGNGDDGGNPNAAVDRRGESYWLYWSLLGLGAFRGCLNAAL